MQITPRKNHRFVQALYAKIVPDGTAVRVPVRPEFDAQIDECFLNVTKKISRSGGQLKHGWCIWELPGLFIEAEFHGVWADSAGQLVDVTPKAHDESEILFLPDNSITFDEKTFSRRDNIRMAMKDDPSVHEFIKASEEFVKYLEDSTHPTDPSRMVIDQTVYANLTEKKMELQMKMEALPIGRNDMCRCGSAEKYKRCCGK